MPKALSVVRFRFDSAGGRDTGRLRFAWAESASAPINRSDSDGFVWEEADVSQSTEYRTITFSPSWAGIVGALYFEWADCALLGMAPNVFIDYIAVVSGSGLVRLVDGIATVRLAVDGRRASLWIGPTAHPLIDLDDFLVLADTRHELRFGKLTPSDGESAHLFCGLRFRTGTAGPPLLPRVLPAKLRHRLPRAGGMRVFVHHQGALWVLADGIGSGVSTDNPDDRTSQSFRLDPTNGLFARENHAYPRNTDGTALVRPLAAASYQGALYIAGQATSVLPQ